MTVRDYRPVTRAPSALPAPQISVSAVANNGIQSLAGGIVSAGHTIQAAQDEVAMNDARLDLLNGVGDIKSRLSEDQDFATMDARYAEELDGLQKRVLDGAGSKRVGRRMSEEFARARLAVEANVQSRRNMLEGGHARATLAQTLRGVADGVPAAESYEEGESLYKTGLDAIASLETAGHLTPEAAQTMRQNLEEDVSTAFALDAINTDATAAAEALAKPGAFGLGEIARQRFLSTATRQAESEARQAATKLESRLDTARGVLVRGGVVDPQDLADLKTQVAGTEYEPQLEGALKASEQLGSFYSASAAERAALLAAERGKGIDVDDASVDGAYLKTLEAIDAQAKRDLETDPVKYAMTAGIPGAAPLDLGDQESVNARMALVVELTGEHGAKGKVFTKEEREYYEDLLGEGSVDDQLALVVSINSGFGQSAPAVYDELGGVDPVVRRAGMLVAETGSDQVARTILAGRKAMAAGDELKTIPEDRLVVFEGQLDGAFGSRPGMREEVIEAVKAYYAAKAPGQDLANAPRKQRALLTEAVQRVTGGEMVDGVLYGGVQAVNGHLAKLPPTLSSENVTDLIDGAGAELWAAGSLSGKVPHEGDNPVDFDRWSRPVLQWVGGTTYRVGVRSQRGGVEWYQDPAMSNGYFYVDLYKMADAHLRTKGGE